MAKEDIAPDRVALGEDYFNRGHWLTRLQVWLSLRKRAEMYRIWRAVAGAMEGARVLDFGTTPDTSREDSNCVVHWLVRDGAEVSLLSVEDVSHLGAVFPAGQVRVLPRLALATGDSAPPIPLESGTFDWVCSSAVLEHVGSEERQLEHLKECGRIGRGVFLTTPARDHWLEFHTKLPLLHWLPRQHHRTLLRFFGYGNWAKEEWLRLLSAADLARLARQALGDTHDLVFRRIRALGATSNLVLIARLK